MPTGRPARRWRAAAGRQRLATTRPGHRGTSLKFPNRLAPLVRSLAGIPDRLKGREFDVVEFAVHLLDLADIDVLNDVARLGVDRNRAARALPGHALHRIDQRVAAGLPAGFFQRAVDQMDAVVAANGDEARA